jgi:hypothetical protein
VLRHKLPKLEEMKWCVMMMSHGGDVDTWDVCHMLVGLEPMEY